MSLPGRRIRFLYVAILPGPGKLLGQVLFFRVGLCNHLVSALFPALAEQEERYTNTHRHFLRHLRVGVSSALEAGFSAGAPLDTRRSSDYRFPFYLLGAIVSIIVLSLLSKIK